MSDLLGQQQKRQEWESASYWKPIIDHQTQFSFLQKLHGNHTLLIDTRSPTVIAYIKSIHPDKDWSLCPGKEWALWAMKRKIIFSLWHWGSLCMKAVDQSPQCWSQWSLALVLRASDHWLQCWQILNWSVIIKLKFASCRNYSMVIICYCSKVITWYITQRNIDQG